MKILQIGHRHFVGGGSDRVMLATSALLGAAGHQVVPFAIADPRNLPSPYEGYFPPAADTGSPRLSGLPRYIHNGAAARALDRLIRDHGPFDVAHLHIYHGKQTPAILPVLRRHGIAVLHSLHEYKLACPVYTMERHGAPCRDCVDGGPHRALRHRCKDGSLIRTGVMVAEALAARLAGDVRLVDRFLCVSRFQADIMRQAGLPQDKLHVLHNFAPSPVTPDAGTGSGAGEYFLYAGRIERAKGLGPLVAAARQAGIRLVIAGEGAWQDGLAGLIGADRNIDQVGFCGPERLEALIAGARAVLVPSLWFENCPMAVLEAKAQGKAVIASEIGGIPELVRDGVDGLLVPPGDAGTLARALQAMTRERAARMGRNAALDAGQRFSERRYLDRLLDHYAAVAQNPGARPEYRRRRLRNRPAPVHPR